MAPPWWSIRPEVLRLVLIVASAVILVIAAALLFTGKTAPAIGAAAFWALLILVGLILERRRYKRVLDSPPGPDWSATAERFIDTETGAETVVYFNPKTGGRAYVRVKA
jgi:hypothetical protein